MITINIDIKKIRKNYDEYSLNINFNKLDLILNQETINELIILFYSSYLNFEINDNKHDTVQQRQQQHGLRTDSSYYHFYDDALDSNGKPMVDYKLNINFKFDQLNLLLFYINENSYQAQKFALLTMNGAYLNVNKTPNLFFIKFYLNALNILDLSTQSNNQQNIHKYIFGIGLDRLKKLVISLFPFRIKPIRVIVMFLLK